jgi:hypothetical protein
LDQHLPFLKVLVPQWGYVVFAIAAGFVVGDKLFGFSTGWIRFIKTQLTLESALTELRYDWLALFAKLSGDVLTQEQIQTLIQRLKTFVVFVHAQVQRILGILWSRSWPRKSCARFNRVGLPKGRLKAP